MVGEASDLQSPVYERSMGDGRLDEAIVLDTPAASKGSFALTGIVPGTQEGVTEVKGVGASPRGCAHNIFVFV